MLVNSFVTKCEITPAVNYQVKKLLKVEHVVLIASDMCFFEVILKIL